MRKEGTRALPFRNGAASEDFDRGLYFLLPGPLCSTRVQKMQGTWLCVMLYAKIPQWQAAYTTGILHHPPPLPTWKYSPEPYHYVIRPQRGIRNCMELKRRGRISCFCGKRSQADMCARGLAYKHRSPCTSNCTWVEIITARLSHSGERRFSYSACLVCTYIPFLIYMSLLLPISRSVSLSVCPLYLCI